MLGYVGPDGETCNGILGILRVEVGVSSILTISGVGAPSLTPRWMFCAGAMFIVFRWSQAPNPAIKNVMSSQEKYSPFLLNGFQ